MRNFEKKISRVLSGPWGAGALILAAVIFYCAWMLSGQAPAPYTPASLVDGASGIHIASPGSSATVNLLVIAAVGFLLWMLNRWYFITHSTSRIYIGLYALGVAVVPSLCTGLNSGTVMCAVLVYCVMLLYTLYQRPNGTRRVFFIFCMLSAGTIFDYAYVGYALPMILACGQMRCMSLRTILAAAIGLAVPVWIGWGFDLFSLDALRAPTITFPSAALLSAWPVALRVMIPGAAIFTIVLTLVNTVTIYGHNAKTRANNGVLALLSLWTAIAPAFDFAHAASYLPVMLTMLALQTALCLSLRSNRSGYLAVAACILLYLACGIWLLF